MNVWGKVKKVTLGGMFVGAMMLASSLTVTGCLTDDKKDSTSTTPTDTTTKSQLTTKMITLGAQNNTTTASALDLDTWTAYKAAEGATHSADVDIIFAYSTSASMAALYSPNIAKNGVAGASSGFDFMSTWPNANTTLMRSVATADTTKLKTQADIQALYNAGTDPSPVGRIEAKKGSYVVAKSDKGLYVLLGVTDVTASATGTVNLTGWAKW
jgi:outer membrane murein-binding lipoprotein Lpp